MVNSYTNIDRLLLHYSVVSFHRRDANCLFNWRDEKVEIFGPKSVR